MPLLRVVVVFSALNAGSAIFKLDLPSPNDGLAVHEWGTFTSIADADGKPMRWASLDPQICRALWIT